MRCPSFHAIRPYLWPLAMLLVLFFASGTPRLAAPDIDLSIPKDKVVHFLFFGLLATAILRTPLFNERSLRKILTVVLICALIGGLDEMRQSFTPERSVELDDWYADSLGAIVAAVVYAKWTFYRSLLEWRPKRHREK